MTDLFTDGAADLSGIDGTRSLVVTDVKHKVFMDLNEKGTEAAAATAVVMAVRGAAVRPKEPIEVKVDRPFLFAIQHRPSGACLFLGRVTDPR